MRLHRFYVTQPLGEEVVIVDVSIIKQWSKVFRYSKGDFVILFNGDGNDYRYCIDTLTTKECMLSPLHREPSYIPRRKTYLYLSLIKKDNFELVVAKATELGVTDIIPIISRYTEKKNLDRRRLTLIAQEAAEQSGRGDVLQVHEIIQFSSITSSLEELSLRADRVFAATLSGESIEKTLLKKGGGDLDTSLAFLIGPEGGWREEEEIFFKEKSFNRISLGDTILRAETAAIVCSFLSSVL